MNAVTKLQVFKQKRVRTKFNKAYKMEAVKRVRAGESAAEVAHSLGIRPVNVQRWASLNKSRHASLGLSRGLGVKHKRHTPAVKAEVLRRLEAGESHSQVYHATGVKRGTISSWWSTHKKEPQNISAKPYEPTNGAKIDELVGATKGSFQPSELTWGNHYQRAAESTGKTSAFYQCAAMLEGALVGKKYGILTEDIKSLAAAFREIGETL